MHDTQHKQLIIGAGFVGLGIAQALKAAGIPYDQVDASDDIGGNWHHGVYTTAHIISSKKVTQFTHFPMPAEYPAFPSAQNMVDYLRQFADHFRLQDHIQLGCKVILVRPIAQNRWEVTFDNAEQSVYKGVILCNGHHWCKKFPDLKGRFNGPIWHSKDYRHPDQLQGKRVLVIGGGNSACDIAAEAARVGAKSILSLRESVWFMPKSFAGIPIANLAQPWTPEWLQRLMVHSIIRLTFGSHKSYGLPKPKHRIFAKHPTLNNEVPYYIQHGRIAPKPAVDYLEDDHVHFVDGSIETIDLIVCATGYKVAYPFLPPELQRVNGPIVECYAGSLLSDYKGLYFLGWRQARGGLGSLIAAYGQIFAQLLKLQDQLEIPLGLVFKDLGVALPKTHLSDPQVVFRQLRLLRLSFPWLKRKANQMDKKYAHFENQPIVATPKTKTVTVY
ncbi:NAD(P)-binding domain-containing protein [filamentous cyanobacterium LEGE 11480]|uniref:NAD(P)-binding domain-containing protein n=1 Tax=Romeriopsis navalis LEGE 11480 TaxID=2777977 RepID=A0A928VP40_9CYAN|nr:NAD(P)-binding domain-containing protein [Romeriopsis navalis]MBE9031238.1 NAD(P)-binding domain-containing protein [Romeriopsis navalis LEGE 11480]